MINYEKIIHPLWGLDRTVDANNDGMPDVDGNGVVINHKCNTCHGPKDAMAATQAVPAGQLDLSDGLSNEQADHFNSYREPLLSDNEQCLNMGALQDRLRCRSDRSGHRPAGTGDGAGESFDGCRECARVNAVLRPFRRGRGTGGSQTSHAGGEATALGMAGYRCPVLQQPLCRAAQLTECGGFRFSHCCCTAFLPVRSVLKYAHAVVADPVHRTAPRVRGVGYPVFHVVERGAAIEILKRRTDWFKVRTEDRREGWVDRTQMLRTLQPDGEQMVFNDGSREAFTEHRWEAGVLAGDFDGASVI